jgi:microcystin-dependent protein
MTSVRRDFFTLSAHQRPSVGDTKTSALGIDHMGWLLCDGRFLNRADFLFLFNLIGYSFGGSGAQFQLPNPAGRVPGIIGSGAGLTPRIMGATVGTETHVLTIAEMPTHNHGTNASDSTPGNNLTGSAGGHTHSITDPGHSHSYVNQPNTVEPAVSLTTVSVADNVNVSQTTGSSVTGITINAVGDHQHSIASQGSSQPHNNMQPTLFVGNLFIFSGKNNYGNYPLTAGYYGYPATTAMYSNVL